MAQHNILDIAKYTGLNLLSKGLSVSPLKLQKILYYEQAWYMVFFNKELLFTEEPEAWVNGPVYRTVYDEYKGKVQYMTSALHKEDFIGQGEHTETAIKHLVSSMSLTKEEVEFLNSVFDTYGTKSQDQLVLLTHSEKPWADTRAGLAPFEHCERKINLGKIYDYYNNRLKTRRTDESVSK